MILDTLEQREFLTTTLKVVTEIDHLLERIGTVDYDRYVSITWINSDLEVVYAPELKRLKITTYPDDTSDLGVILSGLEAIVHEHGLVYDITNTY